MDDNRTDAWTETIPSVSGDLSDQFRDAIALVPFWVWSLAIVALLAGLTFLANRLRRWGQKNTASKVTTMATALGLMWSAQGMYDVATDPEHYNMPGTLAAVAFAVFEGWVIGRMLRAAQHRHDPARRARFVRQVWLGGCVMATVVALGEGWAQAPARLAIPLLVVYGWCGDLMADDDPAAREETEWVWTWRKLGQSLGLLKRKNSDVRPANEADRQDLLKRLIRLGYRDQIGAKWFGVATRRRHRLAALMAQADPDLRVQARIQVTVAVAAFNDGMRQIEATPEPPPAPDPVPAPRPHPQPFPISATTPEPGRATRIRVVSGGEDMPAGEVVQNYRLDALRLHRRSQTPDRPAGMTADELAACYDPRPSKRTAETLAAEARKDSAGLNGHIPAI